MRLHTNTLSYGDVIDAASIARVGLDIDKRGSRSRAHAFDVHLTGESRRRPNSGHIGHDGREVYAATWDQWGVFLAVLFDRDPQMWAGGTEKRPIYASRDDFERKTNYRFERDVVTGFWPEDAHGDHRWVPGTDPRTRECAKCSAVQNF